MVDTGKIKVKIISTEKVLASKEVSSIFIPLPKGTLEILPGHCNYTGIMSKGKISYKTVDEKEEELEINSGVCALFEGELNLLIE